MWMNPIINGRTLEVELTFVKGTHKYLGPCRSIEPPEYDHYEIESVTDSNGLPVELTETEIDLILTEANSTIG